MPPGTRRSNLPPREAIDAARTLGDRRARPNVRWLADLLGDPPGEVRRLLAEVGRFERVHLEIHDRHDAAGRRSYAQFRAPFELYALIRRIRPDHVVETGVSSGVSSAYALLALARNHRGTLHSIDLPQRQQGRTFGRRDSPVVLPPGRATGWAVPERLRRPWDLRLGSSRRLLPKLVGELPSIGLFLHDSRHTPRHLAFELATVRPKLRSGSIVLADNTIWTGQSFPQFARSLGARFYRRGASDLVGLRVP